MSELDYARIASAAKGQKWAVGLTQEEIAEHETTKDELNDMIAHYTADQIEEINQEFEKQAGPKKTLVFHIVLGIIEAITGVFVGIAVGGSSKGCTCTIS